MAAKRVQAIWQISSKAIAPSDMAEMSQHQGQSAMKFAAYPPVKTQKNARSGGTGASYRNEGQ